MNSPKILIADDELSITKGLSAVLSDEGYEVVVFDSLVTGPQRLGVPD